MKLYTFRAVPLPIVRKSPDDVIQVCREISSRTILVLLESCLQTCMAHIIAEYAVNKLLMMGRGTVRNM